MSVRHWSPSDVHLHDQVSPVATEFWVVAGSSRAAKTEFQIARAELRGSDRRRNGSRRIEPFTGLITVLRVSIGAAG